MSLFSKLRNPFKRAPDPIHRSEVVDDPLLNRLTILDKYHIYQLTKNKTMISKLKSRKLWVTVAATALATLGTQLGMEPALVDKLIYLAMTYIGAQAWVDSSEAAAAKGTPGK